ncbi:hypothetical protein SSP24_48790 [Streptomyces spinoverrucosus]|uniref:Secreted protein n=1 Tax=Streptomyces spinoverrucosus TaxID=284043 RepID=A0A4Y3VJV1_9ACTN|nr:hypothetical protein [Streptomyces spinoverrucosus]GEC07224.1 hypothetical protein SSP24_48790 [Streptomyces spinoverrucosus]GHB90590.1 hypothetical protein GCM10010397_73460 [Streptomyces spinoverrucosus]
MRNKVSALSALAAGIVLAAGGTAAAGDGDNTTVTGGSGFSQSPIVVNEPQQGLAVVNGSLVDGRCLAPWSNGAVIGGIYAPNSRYAACNTEHIDQSQLGNYISGLL